MSQVKPLHSLLKVGGDLSGRATWGGSPAASEAGGKQGGLDGRHVTSLGILHKYNFPGRHNPYEAAEVRNSEAGASSQQPWPRWGGNSIYIVFILWSRTMTEAFFGPHEPPAI